MNDAVLGEKSSANPIERNPRPVVALPPTGLAGGGIAAVAIACAVLLFILLNAERRNVAGKRSADGRAQVNAFAAPPPLIIPPEPRSSPLDDDTVSSRAPHVDLPLMRRSRAFPEQPSSPILVPTPASQSTPASTEPTPGDRSRDASAPALVIDTDSDDGERQSSSPSLAAGSAGQQRAGAGGEDTPVRATLIRSRTMTMPTGTVISATLETPIDSARPGLVRAVVSQDARGFDGQRILVPRGSRLIGEYQSDVRSGQNRVLVTWSRLIRPDGVSIRISSPAADQLGGAGVPGRVNSFFFQRFASAVLQSALTVGVNLASRTGRGSVIIGLPTASVTNVVDQSALGADDLRSKIKVKQGTALHVFVARDLDFTGTPASR